MHLPELGGCDCLSLLMIRREDRAETRFPYAEH